MSDSKPKGMPIYLNDVNRLVADAVSEEDIKAVAWYPSNSAAQKLWRCLESMRDLNELLSELKSLKNSTKRKRRLKIAITPLHSLILAIDDLCNDIQCNPETKRFLKDQQVKEVFKIKQEFSKLLPHDHKAIISSVRNKLSSHINKKLHPTEAQKLISSIQPSEFGKWLHICLHIVLDLTKLDIYAWACDAPSGYVSLMTNEPYIVTIKPEGVNGPEFAGLHIAKSSPRNAIPEIVESLLKHSVWMFKKGQPHIVGIRDDNKENWNTFLSNSYIYKSSNKIDLADAKKRPD